MYRTSILEDEEYPKAKEPFCRAAENEVWEISVRTPIGKMHAIYTYTKTALDKASNTNPTLEKWRTLGLGQET